MDILDLRSDSVSTPTDAMLLAMQRTASGPQAFSPDDDVHMLALEAEMARVTGMEAALFCPTCTAANQIAIHVHCRPGQAVIAQSDAHVVLSEHGGPAALSGVSIVPADWQAAGSTIAYAQAWETACRSALQPGLLWLENSHVRSGGTVMPLDEMASILAQVNGRIPAHLDASRLFNAAAALRVAPSTLCAGVDSVSVSLNKGLSAPFGAVLAGRRTFIDQARHVRARFAATMRNASIAAAAAVIALRDMPQAMARDNHHAGLLAQQLSALPGLAVAPAPTNILLMDIAPHVGTTPQVVSALADRGVLALDFYGRLRMVLWHGIAERHLDRIADAMRDSLLTITRRQERQ